MSPYSMPEPAMKPAVLPASELSDECTNLLRRLQERYSRVVYRPECRAFEIGDVLLLSPQEAIALLDRKLTPEEIMVYRHLPWDAFPDHIKQALCRTPPWM
jgi:hypothetical protein